MVTESFGVDGPLNRYRTVVISLYIRSRYLTLLRGMKAASGIIRIPLRSRLRTSRDVSPSHMSPLRVDNWFSLRYRWVSKLRGRKVPEDMSVSSFLSSLRTSRLERPGVEKRQLIFRHRYFQNDVHYEV